MESGKGIFPTTGGQRKKRSKVLSDRAKLDRFADLLADGYEPDAAAIMMGCVPEFGATMLARICRKLGSQAR